MSTTYTINKLILQQANPGSIVANIFYKKSLDPNFILLASNLTINADGTLSTPQSFSVDFNTYYDIKAVDQYCGDEYTESIVYPCSPSCDPGYALSEDGTYCYQVQTTAATPPTNQQNAVAVQQAVYSVCGSYIFSPGYNVNGTGTATQISPSNSFWINGSGGCTSTGTTGAGPANRLGIWGPVATANQTVGFSVCITAPTTGTYYVGIAGDDYPTIQIDGTTIVQIDPLALDDQLGLPRPPGIGGSTFRAFCIYPVTLSAGSHVLAIVGVNGSTPGPNPAMIAGIVLDNTAAEIAAATSNAMLNIIFSTQNVVGQPIEIGTYGYNCAPGYTLSMCDSPIQCVRTVTVPSTC